MFFEEPAGGWPLRLAIIELVREPSRQLAHDLFHLENLAQRRGGPDRLDTERRILWYDVQEQLRLGELVAHGRRPGVPTGERIPPDFFDSAKPDYKADTMVAPDLIYYGVRITKARPSHASPEAVAVAWMKENVTRYVPRQRDGQVIACRDALGIKKDAALFGWNALPEAIKGVSRTPKK